MPYVNNTSGYTELHANMSKITKVKVRIGVTRTSKK